MTNHKYYLALLSILSIGIGFLLVFNYNRQIQIAIILAICSAYVIWGGLFHLLKKEFYWHVLFEYFVVALVVGSTVIYLLSRA
jgi:hypothetical protein